MARKISPALKLARDVHNALRGTPVARHLRDSAVDWAAHVQEDSDRGQDGVMFSTRDLALRKAALDYARAFYRLRFTRQCLNCMLTVHEEYMVHNEVWRQVAKPQEGVLHLVCLEAMLGRPLTIDDFTTVPVNNAIFFGYRVGVRTR